LLLIVLYLNPISIESLLRDVLPPEKIPASLVSDYSDHLIESGITKCCDKPISSQSKIFSISVMVMNRLTYSISVKAVWINSIMRTSIPLLQRCQPAKKFIETEVDDKDFPMHYILR